MRKRGYTRKKRKSDVEDPHFVEQFIFIFCISLNPDSPEREALFVCAESEAKRAR